MVESQCYAHVVVRSERFVAVGAFPHARGEPFFNTLFAKDVTTRLDHCVLEVFAADGADCYGL